jgi:hypothetical protein
LALERFRMRLSLTAEQHEHLRHIRQAQLADWRAGRPQIVDELFINQDVVRLMSGMGRAAYLGLDGRVWVGNLGEGEPPLVLEDVKSVASCIVRWSGTLGLPELVDALPAEPEGGLVCPLCEGSREMPGWVSEKDDGFRYFCKRCGGLGWVVEAQLPTLERPEGS